jgi:hypothetical protein
VFGMAATVLLILFQQRFSQLFQPFARARLSSLQILSCLPDGLLWHFAARCNNMSNSVSVSMKMKVLKRCQ